MRIGKLIQIAGIAAVLVSPVALVGCDDDEGTKTPDGSVADGGGNKDAANVDANKTDTAVNTDGHADASGDASVGN